jgi:hypothetical protein
MRFQGNQARFISLSAITRPNLMPASGIATLCLDLVAQSSRLRVAAASRRPPEPPGGTPVEPVGEDARATILVAADVRRL